MGDYFTKEQEEKIIYLYTKEQRGQLYCAKSVGSTNVKKVKEVLRKNHIPIRNFSQAASLSNINRTKKKNEEYFDKPTENMAWILGFLASDGSVSSSDNTIKIGISSVDKEILVRIKEEIEIERDINTYKTKDGFIVSELCWTCAKHKAQLAEYGITPRKTFTLVPPYKLPHKYWIDYIRGYFDGDGSINLLHNKNQTSLRFQIGGATSEVLQWIIDTLYNDYDIPKVKLYETLRKEPFYYFQYSTNATKQIYNILYDNGLYLKRKKDHFDNIIQMK